MARNELKVCPFVVFPPPPLYVNAVASLAGGELLASNTFVFVQSRRRVAVFI